MTSVGTGGGLDASPPPVFCEILGTAFRVDAPSPEIGVELHRMLAPFSCPSRPVASRHHFRLTCGGDEGEPRHRLSRVGDRLPIRTGRWPDLFETLWVHLNLGGIDGFTGFATHAGVVSLHGRATAFPAASGEGKSSLVAAALLAGFDYVSDEALCVNFASRTVVAYPRLLGLSSWTCEALGVAWNPLDPAAAEATVAPSVLGASPASTPVALAHIVKLRRDPSCEEPKLVAAPRRQGALWLLQHSFNHYKRPQDSFDLVAELAISSNAWYLDYRDLSTAAALVRDHLGEI